LGNNIISSDIGSLKQIGNNNEIINCKFIGKDIVIGNNNTLKNCVIASETFVTDSYIENTLIGKGCTIGPFARLRENTNIGDNCRIGNFVEIKNSQISKGVKIAHLAYVGDAIIGENTNIGCGVVFANYNGHSKNISRVGKNCFIGSNVNIVAPIIINDDIFVCAGTTITEDTNPGDFVIGRARAIVKKKYSYYLKNKYN